MVLEGRKPFNLHGRAVMTESRVDTVLGRACILQHHPNGQIFLSWCRTTEFSVAFDGFALLYTALVPLRLFGF